MSKKSTTYGLEKDNTSNLKRRNKVAIQLISLFNSFRFSKLIFITAAIFIENKTKKNIYIYHIPLRFSFFGI